MAKQRKRHSYNPARNALGVIMGKCYEHDITFTELVESCGFSSGTASKDKAYPEGIPIERLTLYMAALGINELTIKLEE